MNLEERVDLVDATGAATLFGVSRAEVKVRKAEYVAQGLYQPIVIVIVFDPQGRVIAQVRGERKAGDGDGQVDHVCGVIASGEGWQEAARREAREEIGVELTDLQLVEQSVNSYERYRTLCVAHTKEIPHVVSAEEVSEIIVAKPDQLSQLALTHSTEFVRGFFSDLQKVLAHLSN